MTVRLHWINAFMAVATSLVAFACSSSYCGGALLLPGERFTFEPPIHANGLVTMTVTGDDTSVTVTYGQRGLTGDRFFVFGQDTDGVGLW